MTAIPENIFNATKKKCVVTEERIWAFKHNPYVEHMSADECTNLIELVLVPDARDNNQVKAYYDYYKSLTNGSQTEYVLFNLGVKECKLRHPRLYVHEEEKINRDRVIVHTSGSDRTKYKAAESPFRAHLGEDCDRILSDDIIESIKENYKDYELIQIGSENDKPVGGNCLDMRGKYDYWEVAKLISGSSKFIGVNSGPMHIANCYPKVEKRIILQEFPELTLQQYKPGDIRNFLFTWLDPSITYFNKFEHDLNFTTSYKFI